MGLFDFLKKKPDPIEKKVESKKSNNVEYLNKIQKEVHQYLKPLGFKKRGRTFNRETENGIWQVINFQSGQFPVGENYEIPGIRESLYGKFTINMGVIVKELYEIKNSGKEKAFYQEYDCQIRTRLSQLIWENDDWWNINKEIKKTSEQIIQSLNNEGMDWLDKFETREKICANLEKTKNASYTAKLDIALIISQTDKKKGSKLIQEYYDNIDSHKGHKEYVKKLADNLEINLKDKN